MRSITFLSLLTLLFSCQLVSKPEIAGSYARYDSTTIFKIWDTLDISPATTGGANAYEVSWRAYVRFHDTTHAPKYDVSGGQGVFDPETSTLSAEAMEMNLLIDRKNGSLQFGPDIYYRQQRRP